jgi:hypothetical protein
MDTVVTERRRNFIERKRPHTTDPYPKLSEFDAPKTHGMQVWV